MKGSFGSGVQQGARGDWSAEGDVVGGDEARQKVGTEDGERREP
jgi:hypothetical protein